MKKFIHWPTFLIFIVVAGLVGYLFGIWTGLGFWPAFVLIVLSLMFNGWLATFEDEAPGGFNNPISDEPNASSKQRPSTGYKVFVRSTLAVIGICILAAIFGYWWR